MAKKEAPKVNPKDFGFDKKAWDEIDANYRNWIVLNKELFKNLTKFEKEALAGSKEFTKSAKVASEAVKDVRDLAKDYAKQMESAKMGTKAMLSAQGTMAGITTKIFQLDQKNDKLSQRRVKTLTNVVDITGDYLSNVDAIGTEEFRSLDFNKQIRDAVKAKLPTEESYLRTLKAEHDIQKKLNNEINTQSDLIKKPFDELDSMVKNIPFIGELLSSKLDLKGKGQNMADAFTESVKSGMSDPDIYTDGQGKSRSKSTGKFAKSQEKAAAAMKRMAPAALAVGGAIAAWTVSTFNFSRELGVSFSELNISAILFKDQTKALLDEFGSLRGVSNEVLLDMKLMSFFTGAQAGDMAKVLMLQTSITNETKGMALDRQSKFMKEIKKEGLSASKVMGDLASNADMFANFAKDGGKNMEEAAKQAAKMGLDLSATNSVAEKLLDFESSIAAEQEASMLLGRSINLDKARSLAFSGDLAQMMEEVKMQAGGEAEFARMSVVQRQSLGDAIGLSGANLAEFMKTQEDGAKNTGKSFAMYGAVLGGVFGLLVAMKTVMKGIVNPFAGILSGSKDLIMGAAMVAGGSMIGGGIGYAAGRERGGPVRSGSPYVVGEKRPELFVPGVNGNILPSVPRMAEGTMQYGDMAHTNSKLDKLVSLMSTRNEQAEVQTKKLGRDMNNSFTAR
jgi:hypothetical protein